MIYTQNSRNLLTEFLILSAAFGSLKKRRSKAHVEMPYILKITEAGSSVHEDGIYDIDEECMKRKSNPIVQVGVIKPNSCLYT